MIILCLKIMHGLEKGMGQVKTEGASILHATGGVLD